MSLINSITALEIKKIFKNNNQKRKYLEILSRQNEINLEGRYNLDQKIIETWNYDISKSILREMFCDTDKYLNNKQSANKISILMNEWQKSNLGNFDWPFPPQQFDQFVHKVNRSDVSEVEKDNIVAKAAITYRRIKDINALRNDYIEYLIFNNNQNIIPTFGNSRSIDFYLNGEPFDQKVSRGVGKNFSNKYGENYREIAIDNPSLVAMSLYENQDKERFGSEPRLFVVYLDSDLTIEEIEVSLLNVNLNNPYDIEFTYSITEEEQNTYRTHCYVILLHR